MFRWLKSKEQKLQKVVLDKHGFLEVNLAHPEVVARLSDIDEASSEELRKIQARIRASQIQRSKKSAQNYSQYSVQVKHAP